MAWSFSLFPWLAVLSALFLFSKFLLKSRKPSSKLLPPGPPGLPLVGNIFDLGEIPHQTFYQLQAKYGPVIWLKLGAVNTMVVQSAEAAAELFKKCDLPFADRQAPDSLTALDYHQGSVAIGAYRDYWRRVRRICITEFLVHKRVDATIPIRRNCLEKTIKWIKEEAEKSEKNGGSGEIELDRFLFINSFNVIGNLMLSREVMESKLDKAGEFFDAFILFLEWCGKPNMADCFPFLKWADPQRVRKNTEKYLERLMGFATEIVKERIQEKQSGKVKERNDLLDALLDEEDDVKAEGADKLSVKNVTIVLLEMFFGGTETTSGTIEWGMAELLRHPSSMKKIQEEIDRVVGRSRMVEESDLNELPYLQATVKEILRLYPPIQMLLPRRAMEDTEFMGYVVPKNTQIFVNAWAIHRDPAAWPDPLSFKPERFLDSDIDYKGQHFQMIPFGSGRRSCLGMTLGHRMVCLALATLIHAFEWKLGDGLTPETLDMREMVGLTLRKKVPLKVIPTPRE
ncbi:UNVERIFIED_CONTAM: Iridoid oxidase [Sesamum calycinum]|uniref:Flavonoid-6-hydroxylase n=1 Tax=Sesamum calycinum TaxID=2727403 RepID=A0AAW2NTA6_9LAMI